MKKTMAVFLAVTLLCGLVFTSSCNRHNNNLSVNITDSDDTYALSARYDENKTGKVQRFINKSISPNGLFASTDDYFDVTTELQDQTKFYIKSSPGKLLIKFDKRNNSRQSYNRIRNLCEGVARILK